MASIDKIYGTKEQYYEFMNWCVQYKPEATKYFTLWDTDDKFTHVICSLTVELDMWMLKYCDLEWVVDFIKGQYNISMEGRLSKFVKDIDTDVVTLIDGTKIEIRENHRNAYFHFVGDE